VLTADEARKSLIEKLKTLDEDYKAATYSHGAKDTPETLNVTKRSTDELLSDEEIKRSAENVLKNDYENGLYKLKSDAEKSIRKLETSKANAKDDLTALKEKTEYEYGQKEKATKNAAINKGVYRSSIYAEAVKNLDEARLNEFKRINSEYDAKVASYNAQIEIINSDYEKALKRFDIAHAVELENKINDLIKQRDKEELEILKYNNKIEKDMTEYRLSRAKAIASENAANAKKEREEAETEAKIGMYGDKLVNYNKRYEEVYNVLKSLDYENAKDVLQNTPAIKSYLGDSNYKKLNALVVAKMLWK